MQGLPTCLPCKNCQDKNPVARKPARKPAHLYLQDQMNHTIGAIYHILLQPQYGIWTIKPFKGRLVLKVICSIYTQRVQVPNSEVSILNHSYDSSYRSDRYSPIFGNLDSGTRGFCVWGHLRPRRRERHLGGDRTPRRKVRASEG